MSHKLRGAVSTQWLASLALVAGITLMAAAARGQTNAGGSVLVEPNAGQCASTNADCVGAGNPCTCCTGAGTGSCPNVLVANQPVDIGISIQPTSKTAGVFVDGFLGGVTTLKLACADGSCGTNLGASPLGVSSCTCVSNAACTGSNTPYQCCTGAGTGVCNVVTFCGIAADPLQAEIRIPANFVCTGAGNPFACCTGSKTGTCGPGLALAKNPAQNFVCTVHASAIPGNFISSPASGAFFVGATTAGNGIFNPTGGAQGTTGFAGGNAPEFFPGVCGDGFVSPELGETCDPPGSDPLGNGNKCRNDCTFCGDQFVQNGTGTGPDGVNPNPNDGETCDPFAAGAPANCRATGPAACTYCGDGLANDGETCDPNNPNDPNKAICRGPSAGAAGTNAECTYCGDAVIQNPAPAPNPNEQCDNDGQNCSPSSPPAACTCSTACLPCAPVTLGDFIWDDKNRNGIQDAGEPGIPNVQVEIQDCSGNTITTVTTDASGFYKYTTTVCDPNAVHVNISVSTSQAALTGYDHTAVGQGTDATDSDCGKGSNANQSQCRDLTVASPVNLDTDCGFFKPTCGDGFVDPTLGETCEPVACPAGGTCPPNPNQAICRPASGPAGCTYCGDAIVQNPAAAPNPNEQCDNDGSNCSPSNPPAACTCSTACLPCAPVTLGDFIWDDKNRNGIQDPGEPGIPNVEVQIQDCSGNTITTVTTDASGFYKYTTTTCDPNAVHVNISVSTSQAALTGYDHTAVGQGTDATDSDCGKGSNANQSQCRDLTVASPVNLDTDCGFFKPVCGDGCLDSGEQCDPALPPAGAGTLCAANPNQAECTQQCTLPCNVSLEKTVALDDNCDGVADGPFVDHVDQDLNECVVYQVCVHNTGNQILDNVTVGDAALGVTVVIPSVAIGATECRVIPGQTLTNTGPCAGGSCECGPTKTATGGTNTASITNATCHDTAAQGCTDLTSKCSDTSSITCKTCGISIDKTAALDANCDQVADTQFSSNPVTVGAGQCMVYQICVTNTQASGQQAVNGVLVDDAVLGQVGLNFGNIAAGATTCQQLPVDANTVKTLCGPSNMFTNTSKITTATCELDGAACLKTGSTCSDSQETLCQADCLLDVSKSACVSQNNVKPCTGGARALTIKYTGPDIAAAVTVNVVGAKSASYSLPGGLHPGDILTSAAQNGFTLDGLGSSLGSKVTATITAGGASFTEIFHTSCSCKNNPSVNLVPGNPMCLDSGSTDNNPSVGCDTTPADNPACCTGFETGCTAAVCTAATTPLFCCSGNGSYTACKGAASPAWQLVNEVDPTNGLVGSSSNCSGNTLPAGKCADVTYTYTIANNSGSALSNIVCTDDKLGNIGAPSSLNNGQSTTVTKTVKNVCASVTNHVTCTVNGVGPKNPNDLHCQASAAVLAPCVLAYPFSSAAGYGNQDPVKGTPHTLTPFNESEYLRAFAPQGVVAATPGENIQVFFNDEHAMTLGISQVTVKTSNSTTTTNFGITASPSPAACKSPILVGSTFLTGDLAGADTAGRPIWPSLYITDITGNAAACQPGDTGTCCDWQALSTPFAAACNASGEAVIPSEVCGVWKSATRTVDKSKNPNTVTVTPGVDPAKNNWVLGAGSDPLPPAYCAPCQPGQKCPSCTPGGVPTNQGYGAEVKWSIDALKAANVLQTGHIYRFQFMGHDGDQNKTGGDVGEACVNIAVP